MRQVSGRGQTVRFHRISNQEMERETGYKAPSTKPAVQFTYRLG